MGWIQRICAGKRVQTFATNCCLDRGKKGRRQTLVVLVHFTQRPYQRRLNRALCVLQTYFRIRLALKKTSFSPEKNSSQKKKKKKIFSPKKNFPKKKKKKKKKKSL